MALKQKFVVIYDYGMGGVWRSVLARSKEEITTKFPMLQVRAYDDLPDWLDQTRLEKIEAQGIYDIDQEPDGVFASLLSGER